MSGVAIFDYQDGRGGASGSPHTIEAEAAVAAALPRFAQPLRVLEDLVLELGKGDLVLRAAGRGARPACLLESGGQGRGGRRVVLQLPDEGVAGPGAGQSLLHIPGQFVKNILLIRTCNA